MASDDGFVRDRLATTADKWQPNRPPTPKFTHASDQNAAVPPLEHDCDRLQGPSPTESHSMSVLLKQWERNLLGSTASSTWSGSEGSHKDFTSVDESENPTVMLDIASSSNSLARKSKSVASYHLRRLHQHGWFQMPHKIHNSGPPRFVPGKPRLPVKPELIMMPMHLPLHLCANDTACAAGSRSSGRPSSAKVTHHYSRRQEAS